MNAAIALLLTQDGLTNGVIYAFLGLAILLAFLVTRILLVPQGEFVVLGAITLAQLQRGQFADALWLLASLASLSVVAAALRSWKAWRWRNVLLQAAFGLAALAIATPLVLFAAGPPAPLALQITAVLCVVAPMGPMIFSIAFRDIA